MKYLILNKHWDLVEDYNPDKLLYLLVDRPNEIHYHQLFWINELKQNHRNYGLPAKVLEDFTIVWRIKGVIHRENNKPAAIHFDGKKKFFNKGNFIKTEN